MNTWRKYTVIGLVVCVTHLSLADVVLAADRVTPNQDLTRQRVDQFGVGAKVKVKLTDGKRLKGTIQSVEAAGFLLTPSHAGSPKHVRYEEVAQLNLAKNTYQASGQPDTVEARRVVAELAVGKHIMVKTTTGNEYHGNIQAIDADQFTILPDSATAVVQVPYRDVLQLGPNMSKGTKILIIVGVGVAVVVVLAVALAKPSISIPPVR